ARAEAVDLLVDLGDRRAPLVAEPGDRFLDGVRARGVGELLVEGLLEVVLFARGWARRERDRHVAVENPRRFIARLSQIAHDRRGEHAEPDRERDKTEEDPG